MFALSPVFLGAPAVSLAFVSLPALRVIQRATSTGGGQSAGQGSAVVAVTLGATSPVYARRRSYADGTTILQAPWLASASAVTGNVTIPGIDAADVVTNPTDGWFYLDLAPSAGGPWTLATNQVACGRLVGFAGQSLAVRMFGRQDGQTNTNTSLAVTISPYCSILATYNDTIAYMPTVSTMPWQVPVDGGNYNSTFISEFLRRQVATFRVVTGAIGHSQGGVSIQSFQSGQGNNTQLASVIARAGGAFEAFVWYQGHGDSVYGCPSAAYQVALTNVFTQFSAMNSLGSYAKYVGSIPTINSTSWGTPYTKNQIRKAGDAWCTANSANYLPFNYMETVDGIHETQVGAVSMAQHIHRATRVEKTLTGLLGPQLLLATRVGTTITATLSNVGQSGLVLTGTPANLVYVFPTGTFDKATTTQNRFPVSSVTVTNSTTLSIVLANDPGNLNTLDMYINWPNDALNAGTDAISDNRTDADGITLGRLVQPNYSAVVIASSAGSAAVAPPGGAFAQVSPFSMATLNSMTYGAQEQTGFNQTISGGTALAAGSSCPVFGPFTLEMWFTCPTIPASIQVLFGGFASDFVAINSSANIQTGSGTGAVTLVAGKRYHVAYQQGPAGSQIYLTNITDGTAGVRDFNSASAVTLNPGGTQWTIRNHLGSFALSGGTVDEIAVFASQRYSGASYTCPTAPFVGNEANIMAVFHGDGNSNESLAW